MDDSERQEELLKEESFKKVHLKEEQVMVMVLGMMEEVDVMMMLVTVVLLQVMEVEEEEDESEEVMRVFRPLQLLTACFGALRYFLNIHGEICDMETK